MAKTRRRASAKENEDEARERRITYEIVVDAYDAQERAMGWHAYLEDTLQFPFDAVCDVAREISVLQPGDAVTVVGMADADECLGEMFVRIRWDRRQPLAVPLMQLCPGDEADEATREAAGDWRYWVARGHSF